MKILTTVTPILAKMETAPKNRKRIFVLVKRVTKVVIVQRMLMSVKRISVKMEALV